MLCLFYFFKQKTAYEMRISDWSSDVCSSDLMTLADARACHPGLVAMERDEAADRHWLERMGQDCIRYTPHVMLAPPDGIGLDITGEIGRASGRERVCQYVSVSVVAVSSQKNKKQQY